MHKKGKTAICTFVKRDNAFLRYAALIPQKEELDEDGFQLKPPGFNVITLPFADEIRNSPVDETPKGKWVKIKIYLYIVIT
jgi:ATP-dependent DNA helicase 2 subunit 1